MRSTRDKGEAFRALHERPGAFPIPNPWDLGSARRLEALGFEALATTSAGCAEALGRRDGELSLDDVVAHCAALAAATTLPISADLENGFGHDGEAVAECIRRCGAAGVVGGSIEDYTGDPAKPIYELPHAVERIAAAVEAAAALPFPFVLTARCEHLLRGGRDLDEVLRRLLAYEAAGADVLFAPGLSTLAQVRLVTSAVARPVNVLGPFLPTATVADLAAAGAKRISVGSALQRHAYAALDAAAILLRDEGRLAW
ncbi:MAG TPA: isocitrate lyase/phosphoenolpyruvate mutase family protein [Pseudomonadales bacterium]|nr:isocitrate lyase/phosphoenolpyruvate mutase family protein [Pseudomonadales bacterium]